MNQFLRGWLLRTLWIWLPFYGLYALTKELMERAEGKK